MPRTLPKYAAVLAAVLLLLAALYCGRALWTRGFAALHGATDYRPRELLAGGNEPVAPRVAPELEALDEGALEAAARYAGEHGSSALIVSRHEHIVFERYWHGSTFNTMADAQSFTPLLAALAAGVAVSHRRIGWPDEPIGAFISEWGQERRGAITVRNLMQMSSGLIPPAAATPGRDLIGAALAEPLGATPGLVRVPQAADPQLLALVIERATQQRYASYLSQAIWRRIGAADAWLWLDHEAGTPHADCCLMAQQGDWIRVAQLLVRDGNYRGAEVIRPGWVTLMRLPAKSDPEHGAYLRLVGKPLPGKDGYAAPDLFVVGESGGNRMWIVPSLQLAIVRIAPAGSESANWDEVRIPNLIIRAARDYRPPESRPDGDLSKIVPGH
jgi:CubicO group peptidase (beta-lactamase class C family)